MILLTLQPPAHTAGMSTLLLSVLLSQIGGAVNTRRNFLMSVPALTLGLASSRPLGETNCGDPTKRLKTSRTVFGWRNGRKECSMAASFSSRLLSCQGQRILYRLAWLDLQ